MQFYSIFIEEYLTISILTLPTLAIIYHSLYMSYFAIKKLGSRSTSVSQKVILEIFVKPMKYVWIDGQ